MPSGHWLAVSTDGVTFDERRISGPFDLRIAPNALGYFVGDYAGLSSDAANFVPFFAQTRASTSDRADVYTVSLPIIALAKASSRYVARSGAVPQMTPEWAERVRANAEKARHHFYERPEPRPPRQPPPP